MLPSIRYNNPCGRSTAITLASAFLLGSACGDGDGSSIGGLEATASSSSTEAAPDPETPATSDTPTSTGADEDLGTATGTSGAAEDEVAPGVYVMDWSRDLGRLGDIVGDASWVALGESVHTSGGLYRAKVDAFYYLVEEQGFRAFGFESPWYDARSAQRYVETCEGTPETAIKGLFPVWWDTSVAELLGWMCAWNQAHPDDKVHFFGWDIQQGWDDGRELAKFLHTAAPDDAEAVLAGIEQCAGVSYPNADAYYGSPEVAALEGGAPPDAAKHAGCLATLEVLGTYLDTHADELVAASSEAALRWAKISLIGLEAFEGTMYHYNDDEAKSYELRDAGNAYVIQELRELMFPGARVAVWAHNVHIAADSEAMHVSEYAPNSVATPTGWKSMGTRLEEQLGADYVAIGISAYRVQVSWGGDYDLPVPVASESIERLLHTLGHERLLVDLRPQVSSFPPGDEFQLFWQWLVPGDQFDGLLYMDASAGMTYVE